MPSGVSPDDLVWIEDAAREFDRSRRWLQDEVSAGRLSGYKIEGDKRLYLLRSQIRALLEPKLINPDGAQAG